MVHWIRNSGISLPEYRWMEHTAKSLCMLALQFHYGEHLLYSCTNISPSWVFASISWHEHIFFQLYYLPTADTSLRFRPPTINRSVNIRAGGWQPLPAKSHRPVVWDDSVCDYTLVEESWRRSHWYQDKEVWGESNLIGHPLCTDPSLCSCLLWSQLIHALCITPELPYVNILLVVCRAPNNR